MQSVSTTEARNSGKEASKGAPVSLNAVQSFWNELITAMSTLAISLMQNFINVHNVCSQYQTQVNVSTPSGERDAKGEKRSGLGIYHFKVDVSLSSAERLRLFFKSDGAGTNSIELLIQLMTLSYRKACCLKLLKYCRPDDGGNSGAGAGASPDERKTTASSHLAPPTSGTGRGSRSSSITTSEGTHNHENEVDVEIEDNQSISDFMTTEDEDEDEVMGDSDEEIEPPCRSGPSDETDEDTILGHWFESLLIAKPSDEFSSTRQETREESGRKSEKACGNAIEGLVEEFIRDKACPHGVSLSILFIGNVKIRSVVFRV